MYRTGIYTELRFYNKVISTNKMQFCSNRMTNCNLHFAQWITSIFHFFLDEHSAKSTETLLNVLYNSPVMGQWTESQKQSSLIASRNNTFLCSSSFQTGSGDYPAYFERYFSRRKTDGAWNYPPSSAQLQNAWSYTATLACLFIVRCVSNHKDKFLSTSWLKSSLLSR